MSQISNWFGGRNAYYTESPCNMNQCAAGAPPASGVYFMFIAEGSLMQSHKYEK